MKFAGTHLNTRAERGIVRVWSLAEEHITVARNRTAGFGAERTNHEATASPNALNTLRPSL